MTYLLPEELREQIDGLIVNHRHKNHLDYEVVQWCNTALDQLRALTPAPQWISVKERLPEENVFVNATDGSVVSMFQTGRDRKGNLRWEWWGRIHHPWTITHWQPLPPPPEPTEEKKE